MATYRIWPAASGPAAMVSDTASTDLGVQFSVSASVLFEGYYFWLATGAPDLNGANYSFRLYSTANGTTGTLITGTTVTGSGTWTAAAWNFTAITPVTLTGGTTYVAVITYASGSNHYTDTASYWTASITNGPLTAPSTAAALGGNQDAFNEPSTGGLPVSTGGANYWLDVLVADLPAAGGQEYQPPLNPPGLISPASWLDMPPPVPAPADPSWAGPPAVLPVTAVPPQGPVFAPPFTSPSSWTWPQVPPADPSWPPPPAPPFTAASDFVPGLAVPGFATPAAPGSFPSPPGITGTGQVPAQAPLTAPGFTAPSSWAGSSTPWTDPSFTGPGITVTGIPGVITVQAPSGTVTAVTGSPGRIIRSLLPPGILRSRHEGNPGTLGSVLAGTPGSITVQAPAGTVTAATGSPGRVIRRPLPPGTLRGRHAAGPGTLAAGITGTAGIITVTALPGSVTAVTGSIPRQAARTPLPPGLLHGRRQGSPGTLGITVTGTPGTITTAAPAGMVTAVTGSPGRVIRRPVRITPGHGTGWRIPAVPAVTAITAPPGTISVTAPAGTVTAASRVPAPPSRAARAPAAPPLRTGHGTGQHGTFGTATAGRAGIITVTAPPGTVTIGTSGIPGIITVTGGAGWVTNLPPRYVRWHVRHGFAPAGWRSHVVAGNPGMVIIRAVPGTVSTQQYTRTAARPVRAPLPPLRRTAGLH